MTAYPEDRHKGKTMGGKAMQPGSFPASDISMKRQVMAHMWGAMLSCLDSGLHDGMLDVDKVIAFAVKFFQDVSKERYTFLIETDEKEVRRTPLEGSYPYGRTGNTQRDPLAGFCHFKYSKRGEPVVRFIKPGKYTPYHPTSDDVATPYEEQGSKMKMELSGKYRHIASYSVEKLVALGWDGAMYISSRGRHAAKGHYVPFICGYDSDADDTYEPIDIQAGKRAGTIGLSPDENGKFMGIPGRTGRQLVQIKNAL
jgi:hypothetical protein